MKTFTLLKSFTLSALLLLAWSGWGQDVVIDFSDVDAWAGGTMTGYNNKTYAEDGWLFSANDAVRETTEARRIGTYSWRLRNSVWIAENTAEGTYTGFEIKVRPWSANTEPSAAGYYILSVSTDGGENWTVLDDEIGVLALEWHSYSHSFGAKGIEFEIGELQVRLDGTANDHRLNVGEFTAFVPLGEDPLLIASPLSLEGFSYLEGDGPSVAQSFELSGSNLDGTDVTVTAPANFEISGSEEGIYGEAIILEEYDGTETSIWVRLIAGLDTDDYSGNIHITGGGADQINVSVSGRIVDKFDIPYANDLRTNDDFERAELQGFLFVDAVLSTAAGGRIDISPDGYIETPEIDFTEYDYLVTRFDLRNLGTGSDRELTVKVSGNGLPLTPIQTVGINSTSEVTFNVLIDLTGAYNVENGIIRFEMTGGTGGIRFRDLTINEPVSASDIAELRTGATDGTIYRLTGIAVVNFAQSFRNQKWIQDETAAIQIDDDEDIISGGHERFGQGSGITDIVGRLNIFANTLQIIPLADANGPFTASFNIEPTIITMGEFLNDFSDFESQLVTIADVSFTTADGSLTFSNGDVYEVTDGEDNGDFRATFFGVDYIGSVVPETNLNITGILNERTTAPIGKFITARNWADFAFLTSEDGNWPDLPEEAASLVINHDIFLNTDATIANLTITDDKSLTIGSAGSLEVTGTLANQNTNSKSGSGLLIQSDDTGTGSLIHNNEGVEATVERYIVAANWADSTDGWHFISAPVSGQVIGGGSWTPSGDQGDYDFYAWDESETELPWRNQKVAGNNITHFNSAQGYLVAYQQTDTKIFEGPLHAGSYAINLKHTVPPPAIKDDDDEWVHTPGWNLIGNPYASGIDWNLVDHGVETSLFQDVYAYIYNTNKDGGAGYQVIDGSDPNAFIAAHQGFFVLAKESSNNVDFTFTNDMRVHDGTFLKSEPVDLFRLRLAKGEFYDETTIRIRESSKLTRDPYDALKLFSFHPDVPQVYTRTQDDVWVSINSIPEISESQEIPVSIRVPANGDMKLSIEELNGDFAHQNIILIDQLTGLSHEFSQYPVYNFTANKEDDPNRFLLKFETVGIDDLPESNTLHAYTQGNTLFVMNQAEKAHVEVYNVQGQLVLSHAIGQGLQSMQTALAPGAYIVRMVSDNATATRKVVIQ